MSFVAATEGGLSSPALIIGALDLRDAKAAVFTDDKEAWPKQISFAHPTKPRQATTLKTFIYLNGFTYSRFGGGSHLAPAIRRKWLLRQPPADLGRDKNRWINNFTAQPFEQLVKVLRETGNPRSARDIAMFKHACRLRRDHDGKSWLRNPFNWFKWLVVEKAVGYGYRWQRVLIASFFVWLGFSLFYLMALQQGAVCRAQENGQCIVELAENSAFNPWLYSVEGLLVAPQVISTYLIFPQIKVQQKTINLTNFEYYKIKNKTIHMRLIGVELPSKAPEFMVKSEMTLSWLASLLLLSVATGIIRRE